MSWKDTYLIHKLKASQLLFHFSLHLRSLLMSISIRFTFMLSIHSFLSVFLLPSSRLRHAERACELSPSPSQKSLHWEKEGKGPTDRERPAKGSLSLSLRRRLLWSFLFRLVLRRWLLWYATEVFRRFCATSKKGMVKIALALLNPITLNKF